MWYRVFGGVRTNNDAYTVVELMIFLAVSSGLFVMVIATFSGRQAKVEFSTAVREFDSQLQDISNDVSTGFYNNADEFRCQLNGTGAPHIDASNAPQGTNQDCIFVGRVAQFDLANTDGGNNGLSYNLYTVVGARQSGGNDVTNYIQAKPRLITNPPQAVDMTENERLPAGLVFDSMWLQQKGNPKRQIRAVAFFSTFGAGTADPRSLAINIVPIFGSDSSKSGVVDAIAGLDSAFGSAIAGLFTNPDDGILICMNGNATDQHALFKIGGNNRKLSTDVTIGEDTCDAAGF